MGDVRLDRATASRRILLAVEPGPEARLVVAAAVELARQSQAEVLVLSVREREFTRGMVWDRRPAGELAELVSYAIYEMQRAGVPARGIIRLARSGRVGEEIIYAAHKHRAPQIVIGSAGHSRLYGLIFGSVSQRVLRLSDLPVVAVPTRPSIPSGASAPLAPPRTPPATRTPRPR